MLTFFDYLRQRAFESVLAGAQDALDVLEKRKAFSESQRQLPDSSESTCNQSKPNPRKRVEDKTAEPPPQGDDKPIAPPRDRGRPAGEVKGDE